MWQKKIDNRIKIVLAGMSIITCGDACTRHQKFECETNPTGNAQTN